MLANSLFVLLPDEPVQETVTSRYPGPIPELYFERSKYSSAQTY